MNPRRSEYRRDLWLPCLVGAVGVLISVAVWGLLVADRRELLLGATRENAIGARDAIALGLERQIETLSGMESLWREFGLRPLPEWSANVGQRIEREAGLRTVTWVDLQGPEEDLSAGFPRSPRETRADREAAVQLGERARMEGPERADDGQVVYRILLPVHTPGGSRGVLVARFGAAAFLDEVLRARGHGHALSVAWGDTEIYARDQPSTDPRQTWWRVEQLVPLPFGGEWRVALRPTPPYAAERLNPIPHYLLGAGILLAFVVAISVHQLRVIARQSRFLTASNQALERRGQELESKVGERTADLREAIAELETFNHSVSHDLRSPLGAILNFTAILEEDYRGRQLDDQGVAIVTRIHRSAARAVALLEGLLQLSRTGRVPLTRDRIDMTALAHETFQQARMVAGDEDVELELLPLPEAIGDRALLSDVFANLIDNALKYSRGFEKRRIVISGAVAGNECVYSVADNGCGFDMRFAEKLFQLFERLDGSDDVAGTGVGLAMVARIVRRHGGRVWAEGWPGKGARFSFAIPAPEGDPA